ncbi:MAG: hypothetical protein MZV63_35500 [Marinilabiliales bacterium]|nr:hypothetical protein [Marinilabiliales bacterium]
MEKALASFAALKAEKKMVILGDMLELGIESDSGPCCSNQVSLRISALMLSSPHRSALPEVAGRYPGTAFRLHRMRLREWLEIIKRPEGYTILVKGSRGMMLEKLYPLL